MTGVQTCALPILVLQLLNRFFTHTDETEQQLSTLIGAAISMMAGVLRPLATTLTTLPAGPPHEGRTAGFAFDVYYVLGNMVPWREPAWALLHERMALLVQRCAELTHGAPRPCTKPTNVRPPSPPPLPPMCLPTSAHPLRRCPPDQHESG